jgi:uncharacterized repeat protein (TIGR01451 family)
MSARIRNPHLATHGLAALLLSALALGAWTAPAAADPPAVSRDEAIAIVTQTELGGSLDAVRLYVYPQLLPAGETVSTWKRDVFVTPAAGWFLFVDRHPGANWEHPCGYLFVDATTGAVQRFDAMVPPRLQPALTEITHGVDNPPPGVSEESLARYSERLRALPKPAPARGQAYAFIISGGANSSNNHIRYWNDSAFIYRTLVEYYGYADDHIRVCISDGTNPAVDRSDGTNSPPDLDGDGDADIEYPATLQYIGQVFNELTATLTSSDQLFLFTTDHGGQESGWDCYLNLWNWEEMRDDVLAGYIDALPCQTIIGTFEQCFSGGMIDDLQGDGRVIATAARWDEYSYAMGPNYIYDTFVYWWTSAVGWETPSGTPVDADTNDDGMVSMHEAFIYAQANDHETETPQYSSTPAELGDMLNLFGNLQGVYLSVDAVTINDDNLGASHGDGDGVIDFGETIELTIALTNMGQSDAQNVVGTLSAGSSYVTLIAGVRNYGTIPSGGTVANSQPFVFRVDQTVPNGEPLGLVLGVTEDPGTLPLNLSATAPSYTVGITDLDDSSGDGDGIADPGETVGLTLRIENHGGCSTPNLTATLHGGGYFVTDENPHAVGVIPAGQGVTVPGFTVEIAAECPPIYSGYIVLGLTGPDAYQVSIGLVFSVGQIFADAMENGGAQWAHYAGPGGTWTDQWHLETYRNHTLGGTSSWKCGGAGAAQYGNLLYAILETSEFQLPAGAQLTFWHWIDAEVSTSYPDHCYDGGLLQISTNGGTDWQTLTPAGGYPYRIRAGGTPGPFAAETPVWSGTHDWQQVTVDLTGYAGMAKLRWAFGSDGAATREGWYLDDITVLPPAPSGVDGTLGAGVLRLLPAYPNPILTRGVSGGMHFRFSLPTASRADLRVFDATGRCVWSAAPRAYAAGAQQIRWDGRDAAGQPVAAGSYFYRLTVGEEARTGQVTVVR